MTRPFRTLLFGFGLLVAAACSSNLSELDDGERSRITSREYSAPYDRALSATIQVLQDEGYLIQSTNRDEGNVYTEYDESGGFDGDFDNDYRRRISATVRNLGAASSVRFHLILEEREEGLDWRRIDLDASDVEEICSDLFRKLGRSLQAPE
ncbi:MAG: hypothetical protein DWQ01_05310 [Planctomycetota bacterium]|nr:MAG: hypothetical protein DWQ01_05310 [Planctomycetota bacterium]